MGECWNICRDRIVQISVFHNVVINMVNFTLVLQIAAKIGGEAAPPLNNNSASDGFTFAAQKRQLEDAGMVTLIPHGSDWPSMVFHFGQKQLHNDYM